MSGEAGWAGAPVIRLGETASTNDVGRLLAAAGLPEGAVVVASRQTHGRGRRGRSWASPDGGLWCSVLLRPSQGPAWGLLSLAVGVAAAEAIETAAGARVGLRWPNDLVVGGRKAGGVLLEAAGGAVIAGIGINVAVPPEAFPPDVAAGAASLHRADPSGPTPRGLLEQLLPRLHLWYARWRAGDPAVVEAWGLRDVLRGRWVVLGEPEDRVEGTAEGVDLEGALRVRQAGGAMRRVLAGDLLAGGGPSDPAPLDEPVPRGDRDGVGDGRR